MSGQARLGNTITIQVEPNTDTRSGAALESGKKGDLSLNLGPLGSMLGLDSRKFQVDEEHLHANLRKGFFAGLFLVFPCLSSLLLLIYRKTTVRFWEHMAFVLYVQSAVFIMLLYSHLVDRLGWRKLHWDYSALVLVIGVFLYFSLKRFYGQTWQKTLLKFGILVPFYAMSIGVLAGLGFVVGLVLSLQ